MRAEPQVTVIDPGVMANIATINGTTYDEDEDVIQVEGRIDNGSWSNATDTSGVGPWATWSWVLDTNNLSDGTHQFEARVYDGTPTTTASSWSPCSTRSRRS